MSVKVDRIKIRRNCLRCNKKFNSSDGSRVCLMCNVINKQYVMYVPTTLRTVRDLE